MVGEVAANQANVADRTIVNCLQQLWHHGMAAIHEGLDQDSVVLFGGREHLFSLVGRGRHRLLAEHMFPRSQRFERPGVVQRVGKRDIDRFYARLV